MALFLIKQIEISIPVPYTMQCSQIFLLLFAWKFNQTIIGLWLQFVHSNLWNKKYTGYIKYIEYVGISH
jgi:hypothetical protein